jgi:hypothetical protein
LFFLSIERALFYLQRAAGGVDRCFNSGTTASGDKSPDASQDPDDAARLDKSQCARICIRVGARTLIKLLKTSLTSQERKKFFREISFSNSYENKIVRNLFSLIVVVVVLENSHQQHSRASEKKSWSASLASLAPQKSGFCNRFSFRYKKRID